MIDKIDKEDDIDRRSGEERREDEAPPAEPEEERRGGEERREERKRRRKLKDRRINDLPFDGPDRRTGKDRRGHFPRRDDW